MRLWRLQVERFRGIAALDWKVGGRVSCLVGAGDMAKTTILEALCLLGTTRNALFDDYDFHDATTDHGPIVIEGTFGELPTILLADNRFGLDLIGLDAEGNRYNEPGEHDPGVVIRLDVDHTFEPVWRIVSTRNPDGRPLTTRDRIALGITRLGDYPDRQFSLARRSALSRIATSSEDVGEVLAAAYRQAKAAVRETDLKALDSTIESATQIATNVGAGAVSDDLAIRLQLSPTTASGLTLHSGEIPVSARGLGTRRLLALGLELGSTDAGGVLCIDEIEHGLEPHRIRHLVGILSHLVQPNDERTGGHVVFTSHSTVVLSELGSGGVSVVSCVKGIASVRTVPADLTAIVRGSPEALLAKKVVFGEGKTEVGILRAFASHWVDNHDDQSLTHKGIAIIEGEGSSAAQRAQDLASLGYPALLLADSDTPLKPPEADLTAAGIKVVQWAGNTCTEQRVFTDLSWEGVKKAFQVVLEGGRDSRSVLDAILGSLVAREAMVKLNLKNNDLGNDLDSLITAGLAEHVVREAFAAASIDNKWFKRIDSGEALGTIAAEDPNIPGTPFGDAMAAVEAWCHA